jgi:Protease inhibitor Inh
MQGAQFVRRHRRAAFSLAVALSLAALGACASDRAEPPPEAAAAPPPPPPPTPPPIDLGGRWRLAAAGGGACRMSFGNAPGATQGTIAPEGGCPDNFYTSRKWTYEHGTLMIRNHKGEVLAELSFADGRFTGRSTGGNELTLSR